MAAWAIALLAGAASVLSFAPFGLFPLAFASLAPLAWLLGRARRTRDGLALGFGWGFGSFAGGVSWLYVALNHYGGMAAPLAALAIGLFCAYLALYPALAGALFVRWRPQGAVARAALFAGLWVLAEWLRGVVFTGFPWLAIGYSQTPPSPLAGYLPLIGVYGVGGLVAMLAGLLAFAPWRRPRAAMLAAGSALALLAAGAGFQGTHWTTPVGAPLSVALIQTNIEQGLKWQPEQFLAVLHTNAELVRGAAAELVVLPESTLPTLADNLPEGYLDALGGLAADNGGDLVFGVFHRDAQGRIYNAALSVGRSPTQFYAKHHLVPFGEYSPPLFGWFYELVDIPMSDQTRGAAEQPPMALGGQRIALNICYEDLFGAELIRSLPQATMMLNLSNLAWYGDSLAQPQHLQIARVRAIETGRPMLRSTNTGMTAVVQPDGSVSGVLPAFEQGVLQAEVRGYQGLTPYARWGDRAALALAGAILAFVMLHSRSRRPRGAEAR